MFTATSRFRLRAAPALLAAVAIVTWPALVSANCGCRQSNAVASQTHANGQVTAYACPGTEKLSPDGCETSSTLAASCCGSEINRSSEGGDSEKCKCEFRCCHFTLATLLSPVNDEASKYFLAVKPASVLLLAAQSRIDFSELLQPPFSLDAQDYCALLCRWLK